MISMQYSRPITGARQAGGASPVEYVVLFLVVVATVLALIR
jgi:hypothetical protein